MSIKKISVDESVGHVVAHDMTQIIPGEYKGARFKKGHIIRKEDINVLKDMGKENIYVLNLDKDTLHEDEAAFKMASILKSDNIKFEDPHEGKISLISKIDGILIINKDLLFKANSESDILITTGHTNSPVKMDEVIAGVRINPLTIGVKKMNKILSILKENILFKINPYKKLKVGVVITGNEVYHGRIEDKFLPTLNKKFKKWGGELLDYKYLPDEPEKITKSLLEFKNKGADILLNCGGMSVDPDDVTPLGIKNTGAKVIKYGVPVLPGNKLMLAYLDQIPILGLPACVIFERTTVFDIVYPRLLSGEKITKAKFVKLSYGGLCHDCPVCQYPHCSFGKVD
ncbi:MAG: molybdopterin-binding protein [Halanaerobiales bacterium]|nr:molybdopterin-binding protein [Halanaerobiales bacterium]